MQAIPARASVLLCTKARREIMAAPDDDEAVTGK
jgi:hypothetical protein